MKTRQDREKDLTQCQRKSFVLCLLVYKRPAFEFGQMKPSNLKRVEFRDLPIELQQVQKRGAYGVNLNGLQKTTLKFVVIVGVLPEMIDLNPNSIPIPIRPKCTL